jgi:hypothetical protein
LVGEWSTTREWNGRIYPARAFFVPDGKVVWITTLRTERGRYSVQDKNVRLEIQGRPGVEGTFTVSGDRLALTNPRGGESLFERF